MNPSIPCPDRTTLQRLLEGTLETANDALTDHVGDCRACQQTLETLARGDAHWTQQLKLHQHAEQESALRQVIDNLKESSGDAGDMTFSLAFLKPSAHPGSLGRLGPYEVLALLGQGGMGIVLKALDTNLNRCVAIKVLSPHLAASAAARKRFRREAKAAAAVNHEHVVAIYSVDEADGLPYLVMECVAGQSLQQRLDRDGPLPLPEILRIGMQTAAGLTAAHSQGVIHRDIKPANILLENGVERVKITDFGLARIVDDASMTQSGILAGTPQYMAPEQARGEPQDPRTDLFSLGSVLYTLACGRAPFRADSTMAVLRRVREEPARPLQTVQSDIPDWFVEIVEKLHAKDPAQRFQSADEVADLLGRHLAHLQQPRLFPRPARLNPPKRLRGRLTSRHWAAAAVVLLALGLFGAAEATGATQVTKYVATVLRIRTPDGVLLVEVEDPDVKVSVDTDGKELVITGTGIHEIRLRPGQHELKATKDGKVIQQDLVTIARGNREVVRVRKELAEQAKAEEKTQAGDKGNDALRQRYMQGLLKQSQADDKDKDKLLRRMIDELIKLRGKEVAAQKDLVEEYKKAARDVLELKYVQDRLSELQDQKRELLQKFGPDHVEFKRVQLAIKDYNKQLEQWPDVFTTWKLRKRTSFPTKQESVRALAFAPDGKGLAIGVAPPGQPGHRFALDLNTGQVLWAVPEPSGVRRLAFTPDGKTLAVLHMDSSLLLLDPQSGRIRLDIQPHVKDVRSVAFSPDGKLLATAGPDKSVRLWDTVTGKPVRALSDQQGAVPEVAFSPDGRALATASEDRKVTLWDAATGKRLFETAADQGTEKVLAFSRDGKYLAASGNGEGNVYLLDAASGKIVMKRSMQNCPSAGLGFSPDGSVLIMVAGRCDPEIVLWSISTGKELSRNWAKVGKVASVGFSPDGRLLAIAGEDGKIDLWELEGVREPEKSVSISANPVIVRISQESGVDKIFLDGKPVEDKLGQRLQEEFARGRHEIRVQYHKDVKANLAKLVLELARLSGFQNISSEVEISSVGK